MKILLLNQSYYPDTTATAQQILDLATHLKARGCQVSVLCSKRAYENPETTYPGRSEYDGIQVYRVGSTGFGKRSFYHRLVDAVTFEIGVLLKLMFVPRPDLVVSFTSPPMVGVLACLAALVRRFRCAQWLMDVNPDAAMAVGYIQRSSLIGKFLNSVFEWSLSRSEQIIVLDRWMKERIKAHGVAEDRIAVIPPWPVNLPSAALDRRLGDSFRAKHGLTGKFVVMYSGNHSVVHPLDTLLEAALQMRDRKDVVFLFVGGGVRSLEVTSFKEKHALANMVQLPYQPRETLKESLASGDLHVVVMGDAVSGLVHTSKIYGVLATGRPYLFIGPRKSHVSDTISVCPYGFQVDTGDVNGVVRVIEKAKALSRDDQDLYSRQNIGYLKRHCMPEFSLQEAERVLTGIPAGSRDATMVAAR